MNEFNQRFQGLSEAQQQARYEQLALACLAHYPTLNGTITFVAHNAGIVYRIDSARDSFVLKIAEPIGEGANYTIPDYLNSGFVWLDRIARELPLMVQQPIASQPDTFVTTVRVDDLRQAFYCTLQRWLDGQRLCDPSPTQAHQIGVLMAQLHNHGSQWSCGKALDAWKYDGAWLNENLAGFAKVKSLNILSDGEWTTVEKAVDRIQHMMQLLGTDASVWGPVHGDINQYNLLVLADGSISPIDFGALVFAHYGYDLGVTLYHLMYLDVATRQSLVAGYQTVRDMTSFGEMGLEAFLCMAALANLAFNVELPDQRTSALFIRNVREFAATFCLNLINNVPFALQHYDYVR